jgi:antitoxin (DNA-binding transcriptional repressor) of toxin-antitoxin stability system
MQEIKTVGVKELKNNLSAYLREVRRGTRILVSDRSTVVAELHEPGAAYPAPGQADPVISGWIEAGIIIPPARPREALPPSPVALPEGSALRLLDRDREEGGA